MSHLCNMISTTVRRLIHSNKGAYRTYSSQSPVVVHTIAEYKQLRNDWYRKGLSVGFVPTMGALHEGHASLAELAKLNCDVVVASIFVNPAQFAPTEDLDKYPRTLDTDVALLGSKKTNVVFVPSVSEMYPAGIPLHVDKQVGSFVTVLGKSHQMEGSIRPHFFRGVATVVTKLFNIIEPTHAFFGQKDVQQCSVIRTMVRDLHFPIQIVVGDTIRESDGLAKSSRNRYLSPKERAIAPALYAGMKASVQAYQAGVRDRKLLIQAAELIIAEKSGGLKPEYLSIAEPFSLNEVDVVDDKGAILSGALRIGTTRIIDNVLLGMDGKQL
ncbi:Pantoate-beta-alanine ligase [Globomyces pollinis-pini]|nr:Pantoate-beta-alanine ligase [Globomyces pollinis-pini]